MPIDSNQILICRTDNIGDVVLTLPIAARLKQLIPDAKISMLCRGYAGEIVRFCDDVDEVIPIENLKSGLKEFLRDSHIDTLIVAQPDHDIAKAGFQASIRHRVGNARQKLYLMFYCNRRVRFSKGLSENHEAQINFEFLRPFGDTRIPSREEIPDYYHFTIPEDAGTRQQFAPFRFNLVCHAKSNGHGREWPIEYFTELAKALESTPGVHIWLTGSAAEGKWLEQCAPDLLAQENVTSVCGTQSLATLTRFIHQSDGLIASGTGPLHLSAAIGQRTLGLFPPTRPMHPGRWAALGKRAENLCVAEQSCPGCSKREEVTCACMRAITPDQVLQVVRRWMDEKETCRSA